MAVEIERKFLVDPARWHPADARGVRYRQGYLSTDPERVVRVRTDGESGYLTVKGKTVGTVRPEFEYRIPIADAEFMLDRLCVRPLVEKVRFKEVVANRVWEIDVFEGDNAGLVVGEVELPAADATVELPPWVGAEVSSDPRYFNSNLALNPFSRWGDDGSGRAG